MKEIRHEGKTIGFTLRDIKSSISFPAAKAYIAQWKKARPGGEDPVNTVHVITFEYGGDNFSFLSFKQKTVSSEQFVVTLLGSPGHGVLQANSL